MEIKVHKPERNDKIQSPNDEEKPLRMTLKEYLQSTNLKRRINSRSKSKKKEISNYDPQDQNNLQVPLSLQTIQYFKLNQQWKAKKTFSSWITSLKELVRQYIKQDSQYLEVVRLIEKISQFVKSEIQTIKKDNLLLQSYLVSEASYWPEGSSYNQENDNDRHSNRLKGFANFKSSPSQSPGKSLKLIELNSPEIKNQRDENGRKTSTEPKIKTNHCQKHQNTSTAYKKTNQINFQVSETLAKGPYPDLQNQKYIYSFKDKHFGTKSLNSKSSNSHQEHINIRDSSHEKYRNKIQEEDENLEGSKYQQPGLLNIISQNQNQVPRLSLVSRYNQNKVKKQFQNLNQVSKTQLLYDNEVPRITHTNLSQISTKQQIPEPPQKFSYAKEIQTKAPLRDRKIKPQKTIQEASNQFQMIIIEPMLNSNKQANASQEKSRNEKDAQKRFQRTQQKSNNSMDRSFNLKKYEITPVSMRLSPEIILQTPSTLRQKNDSEYKMSGNKKDKQKFLNQPNPIDKTHERQLRSNSAIDKSYNFSYQSTRSNSRQNITKRYELYKK